MVAHPSQVGGDRETATTAGQEEDPRALDHIIKSLGRQISQDVVVDHLIWSDWTSPPTTQSGLTGRHHRSLDWSDSADPSTFLGCNSVEHDAAALNPLQKCRGRGNTTHTKSMAAAANPLEGRLQPLSTLFSPFSGQASLPQWLDSFPLPRRQLFSPVAFPFSCHFSSPTVGGQLLCVDGFFSFPLGSAVHALLSSPRWSAPLRRRPPLSSPTQPSSMATACCTALRPSQICHQSCRLPPAPRSATQQPSTVLLSLSANLFLSFYPAPTTIRRRKNKSGGKNDLATIVGVGVLAFAGHCERRYRRDKEGERLIYTPYLGSSPAVVRGSTRRQWLWRMN
uniref:Uncharacterized protein n=1 Tax=Salix viminalis TaxID=40686 RepID=A0A6N2NH15_SALVM